MIRISITTGKNHKIRITFPIIYYGETQLSGITSLASKINSSYFELSAHEEENI